MRLHARVSDSSAGHMTAPVAWSTPLAAVHQTLNTCTHITVIQLETLTDDKVKLLRPPHTGESQSQEHIFRVKQLLLPQTNKMP